MSSSTRASTLAAGSLASEYAIFIFGFADFSMFFLHEIVRDTHRALYWGLCIGPPGSIDIARRWLAVGRTNRKTASWRSAHYASAASAAAKISVIYL
jgi:hypothetical protein